MSKRWTEVKRSPSGVSVSMYVEDENDHAILIDEAWWTWDEFEETTGTVSLGVDNE